MVEAPLPQTPAPAPKGTNPWGIMIIAIVVFCCGCFGMLGLLIAFGQPILELFSAAPLGLILV